MADQSINFTKSDIQSGPQQIDFNTSQTVSNLILDYNKQIGTNKINKAEFQSYIESILRLHGLIV